MILGISQFLATHRPPKKHIAARNSELANEGKRAAQFVQQLLLWGT
jgi:hypothetical protein